jgi:TolA-binding protein
MANCEVCGKENATELLDGSGMYHYLCEEHQHPKAPEEAPAAEEHEQPKASQAGETVASIAGLERRVAQLEQLQQRDSEISVKEIEQLERRIAELEQAATAPKPAPAPAPEG